MFKFYCDEINAMRTRDQPTLMQLVPPLPYWDRRRPRLPAANTGHDRSHGQAGTPAVPLRETWNFIPVQLKRPANERQALFRQSSLNLYDFIFFACLISSSTPLRASFDS
jgi:hypothetical protein